MFPNTLLEFNAKIMQETDAFVRTGYMVAKEKMAFRKQRQKCNDKRVADVNESVCFFIL